MTTDDIIKTLPKTADAIAEGIERGWHPGAQVCVWRDGETVVNAGSGTATGNVPMQATSVNLWLSSGKPVGAVAVALLRQDNLLDIDLPVADYWPEFGVNGKEAITTRHLLTHTAGIRTAETASGAANAEEMVAALENARIERDWVPGEQAGYHPSSGWQVLGELVHKVSGVPYAEFTRSRIFQPLGMDSSTFNLTTTDAEALGERFATMYSTDKGEITEDPEYSPEVTSRFTRPGGGLRSTASDMVRLYRMLMDFGELDGVQLLNPDMASDITSPQRTGMKDLTFGQIMDWGLGVMLDNKVHGPAAPYGYGEHASPRTFGHGGRESSTAFADPTHNLAVAMVFNGMPGEPTHDRRLRKVTTALYEDLRLD